MLLLLLLAARRCRVATILGAVHIITGQIEKACVGYIMTHGQRGTHMRYHTI